MVKISKTKIVIPVFAVAILAIAFVSYSPIDVSAYYDKMQIPKITGSITIESQDYSSYDTIELVQAMSTAENSVENGKAIWGKLDVIQGFLVYKVGVLSDNMYHKVIVDAGNAKALYVSEGKSKDWKHSDKSGKWKNHYADLTPEERDLKMQQWSEVKDAFFALSIDERAKMIMHFMSMKVQWEAMSEQEKVTKKQEMKDRMEELLPLSVEEKTQKLREYVNSF